MGDHAGRDESKGTNCESQYKLCSILEILSHDVSFESHGHDSKENKE